MISNKVLLLPSLLFEGAGADAIFSVLIAFSAEFIMLPLLIWLKKKHPEKSFSEMIKQRIGGFGGKAINLVLLIFMFIKALLTFSIVYVYFKQEIYQEEFLVLILFCMLPVLTHAVVSGLKALSRTIELFFPMVLIGFFICLSLSLFTPISTPFFFNASAKSIFSSAFKYFVVFDDFIVLYIIIDKINISTGKMKKLYFFAGLGCLMVLLLFFFFYSKYPITAFMHDNALSDLLVFSVQFSAIGRLDVVAMITIMLMTLFQMEIYSFGFCKCFENVFEPLTRKHALWVFDIAFILIFTLFVGNHADIVEFGGGWFSYLAIAVAIIVVVLSLLVGLTRGKDEREN